MTADTDRGFYAYGVVPSSRSTLPEKGMGFSELRQVTVGPVAVVGEWVDLQENLARKRYLTAHTDVLNALAEGGPVLPLQFGSVLGDDRDAVDDLLGGGPDWYAQRLTDIDGLRQFVLRARYDLDEVLAELVTSDAEVARLRERTRDLPEDERRDERVRLGELVAGSMERRRAGDAAWLQEQLEPVVEAVSPRAAGGMDGLAELALAVDAQQADQVEARAEQLAEEAHPWARLSLTGPMAMYDFVPRE